MTYIYELWLNCAKVTNKVIEENLQDQALEEVLDKISVQVNPYFGE